MKERPASTGYSGTPLPQKLGIKPGHRLALLNAPSGFPAKLGNLSAGIETDTGQVGGERFNVIVFFTKTRSELETQFPALARQLVPSGGMWIAWPKRASGVSTDVTEAVVRDIGLEAGLVDNKICAVDETWSGLRFVFRLKDRPRPQHRAS